MSGAPAEVDPRLTRLRSVIRAYGPTITAFSGGIDSTLVAVVSAQVHGERALAVTGVSASLSSSEREGARTLAQELGLAHQLVETHELMVEGYQANAGNRCYFCKSELFARLALLAEREGFAAVASGDNLDDLGDHRPGLAAARDHGVVKPLVEAELGKADIRALARQLGLPNHAKPASPCLASRVPHGTRVDLATLRRIEHAEAAVRGLGFDVFRVRHHGDVARLEVPVRALPRALELRKELVEGIQAAGYRWATLDLAGFRSGGLNVLLSD